MSAALAEGRLHRILVPSFVDGPGSRMAIFLQGCSLACPTCHNPETRGVCEACGACVDRCPEGALSLEAPGIRHRASSCVDCGTCEDVCPRSATPRAFSFTAEDLLAQVNPWAAYLDGLTFTGGESTLQADFLLAAGHLVRSRTGLGWLVDTHGNVPPAVFQALAEASDGFLFDLKALDPAAYLQLTGKAPGQTLVNLLAAAEQGKLAEVRLLLVPGTTAEPGPLQEMLELLSALPGAFPVRLQGFRHHGVRGPALDLPEPSTERLASLTAQARRTLGDARVLVPQGLG